MVASKVAPHHQVNALTAQTDDLGRLTLLKSYYLIIKPGIVYSNVMTGAAGYLFAARFKINWAVFLYLILGMAAMIASACTLNNYIDRGIDAKMKRTLSRPTVTGTIKTPNIIIFAAILALVGVAVLVRVNHLTLLIGVLSLFLYVVVYGISKRRSVHGTLIGALPGSASLVAGYTAFTDRLGVTAVFLLVIMVAWQMAHFYSIAIFRLEDYKRAEVPVWPAVKGIESTKRAIIIYIICFIVACLALSLFGYAGSLFGIVMTIAGIYWLVELYRVRQFTDAYGWARKSFFLSLVVILLMSAMLPLSTVLPKL